MKGLLSAAARLIIYTLTCTSLAAAQGGRPTESPSREVPRESEEQIVKKICDAAYNIVFHATGVCCQSVNGDAFACQAISPTSMVRMTSFCGPSTGGVTFCGSGHDGVVCNPQIDPGSCIVDCQPDGSLTVRGCNPPYQPTLLKNLCRCSHPETADLARACTDLNPSERGDLGCHPTPDDDPAPSVTPIDEPAPPAPVISPLPGTRYPNPSSTVVSRPGTTYPNPSSNSGFAARNTFP